MADLVQDWFNVWESRPGTWIIEEPLHDEEVKSYLLPGRERALLIDTGMGVGDIRDVVASITDLPVTVVLSHAHNDHMGGAWQFDNVGIHPSETDDLVTGHSATRLAAWFSDSSMKGSLPPDFQQDGYFIPGKQPTRVFVDGDAIDLGGRTLEVMHAPGHSRGGLVLLDRNDRSLFSTDVVYLRSLYLLNPDSSVPAYIATLARLAALASDLDRLYPSHGPSPIDPGLILSMLDGMRAIAHGRSADTVEVDPEIEGGREDTAGRSQVDIHDFGVFRVLIAR